MIFNYTEMMEKYKTEYKINKAIANKEFFKIERGIYSDTENVNPIEVIVKKYPNAIFSNDTAYYMHGLTDVIPRKLDLATKRHSLKIKDENINQYFVSEKFFEIGKIQMEYEGIIINIYNKERMLIEMIRNQKSTPFDYYKEIMNSYRKIANKLDMWEITEYISKFKYNKLILKTIQKEVF